jgi:hypothetical protein
VSGVQTCALPIFGFKNVNISTLLTTSTVSLPTATGWTQQDGRGTWTQNDYNVTVMGSANVVTRDNSPLPIQTAAPLVEMLVMEMQEDNFSTTLTDSLRALFAPTAQADETSMAPKIGSISATAIQPTTLEMVMPFGVFLQAETIFESDDVLFATKPETVLTLDHYENAGLDDKWLAFLADLHIQEQKKKKKWHGDDDNWLAEFEKLTVLDLRK